MTDLYDRMREEGLIDPIIVRAMIQGLVGEGAPYPTMTALANVIGVHPEQLRRFLKGTRKELEPNLARAFSLEKVVFYRPTNKTACTGDRSMTDKPENPPAFPRPGFEVRDTLSQRLPAGMQDGMSLLDYFAGQALAGVIARDGLYIMRPDVSAEKAYKVAEAMMQARKDIQL